MFAVSGACELRIPIRATNHVGMLLRGQIGLRVVLVHQRDVIEDVFLFDQHGTHAVVNNHRHFARECRVVGAAIGHRGGP